MVSHPLQKKGSTMGALAGLFALAAIGSSSCTTFTEEPLDVPQ